MRRGLLHSGLALKTPSFLIFVASALRPLAHAISTSLEPWVFNTGDGFAVTDCYFNIRNTTSPLSDDAVWLID